MSASRWVLAHRFHRLGAALADRHYTRQTPGSPQFVRPGKCVVLLTECSQALWVSTWQQYVKHPWPGAWECALFRNEGAGLSSELIRGAVAATRSTWGAPPEIGMLTWVDTRKTRPKRDPGRCFLRAGFKPFACEIDGARVIHRLAPEDFPAPAAAVRSQSSIFDALGGA